MELESKVISREIQIRMYESGKTLGTAESCTGGRIAEAIIATPGASEYFKGAIVSYTNEVKERLLNVDHQLLEEKTAVCEEVAIAMVTGACDTLNVDYAIAATGIVDYLGSRTLSLALDEAMCASAALNDVKERDLRAPDRRTVEAFLKRLELKRVSATVRREMGADIEGACGQLRRKVLAGNGSQG